MHKPAMTLILRLRCLFTLPERNRPLESTIKERAGGCTEWANDVDRQVDHLL